MAIYIILAFLIFMVLWLLCDYYKPKIEIILVSKHYKVYIVYNRWDGYTLKGRVSKYLFKL